MQNECYVYDNLSLDDYQVHCIIVKEEFVEGLGNLLYLKAVEDYDSKYNQEYEDGIGLFWKMLPENDKTISW